MGMDPAKYFRDAETFAVQTVSKESRNRNRSSRAPAPETPDYSHCLTKQQAADALGVTTKTIERMAARNEIHQVIWKRPGRPAIAVIYPDEVERIWRQQHPDTKEGFAIPRESAASEPAREDRSVSPITALTQFFERMRAPAEPKLFMTLREAAEYSGLPKVCLRRLIEDGRLEAITVNARGGKRIRRADLEKL